MEKSTRGETLTAKEQAYLDQLKQAIRERNVTGQSNKTTATSLPKPTYSLSLKPHLRRLVRAYQWQSRTLRL